MNGSENAAMFARIAARYDLANDVLSGGLHRVWRRRLIELVDVKRGARCLDCATGTGDVAFALEAAGGDVTGIDACEPMLREARVKAADRKSPIKSPKKSPKKSAVRFELADVQKLPFDDDEFDLVTIAFGIRNVVDPRLGLKEMARVTKPGGRIAVLEFGQPQGLFGAAYRTYGKWILPRLGGVVAGSSAPYAYLRDSAGSFAAGDGFLAWLNDIDGVVGARDVPLFHGLAHIYVADRR
ncbi:MAG: ubiquinone/menaquinone biosynthesis methyltransferase [Deltaproteobacteria bacterium]|nr:ubiquinone/menaquinone biosynthesis methyltransferase [Deltaproteobacteria bacterium]